MDRTPEQDAAQEALSRLVRQCIAGDSQAWQQLVVSQNRRIYSICYRFTGSATDAEDLTQDVFLKLYKNLASFDLQKGSFQTWITTLARNLLVDHFRRTDKSGGAYHAVLLYLAQGQTERAGAEVDTLRQLQQSRKNDRRAEQRLWEVQGLYLCRTGNGEAGLKMLKKAVDARYGKPLDEVADQWRPFRTWVSVLMRAHA